jgi:hypothetical protein
MDASTVSTVVIAVVALLGVIGGLGRWLYSRGRQEHDVEATQRTMAAALDGAAAATRELTAELRDFKDKTMGKLGEHEVRISVLERVPK